MARFSTSMSVVMLCVITFLIWAWFCTWNPERDWLAVTIWLYAIVLVGSGWTHVIRRSRVSGAIHAILMLTVTVLGICSGISVLCDERLPRVLSEDGPFGFLVSFEYRAQCGLVGLGAIGAICGVGVLRQRLDPGPSQMVGVCSLHKRMTRRLLKACLYVFSACWVSSSIYAAASGLMPMPLDDIPQKSLSLKNGSPVFEAETFEPDGCRAMLYQIRQHTWRGIKQAIRDIRYRDSHRHELLYVFVGGPGTPLFVMEPGIPDGWYPVEVRSNWHGSCEQYVLSQPPPSRRRGAKP